MSRHSADLLIDLTHARFLSRNHDRERLSAAVRRERRIARCNSRHACGDRSGDLTRRVDAEERLAELYKRRNALGDAYDPTIRHGVLR